MKKVKLNQSDLTSDSQILKEIKRINKLPHS